MSSKSSSATDRFISKRVESVPFRTGQNNELGKLSVN